MPCISAGMAKKFNAPGAAARAWSLAMLGVAITLFLVSAVLLWSPYDRRQADLREGSESERKTVAGQDVPAQSAAATTPGEGLPDASSPGSIRQTMRDGVIELDVQPVAGQLRAREVEEAPSDDPVYRPTRDAGIGGGNGGAGGGSGGGAGSNGEDAGAENAVLRNPAAGGAGAGDEAETSAAAPPPEFYQFDPCGMVDCPYGTVCCNPSCGLCAPPDGSCSRLSCSMPMFPISVNCGRNTCNAGEVCCNMSCGICTAPDETCSQRVCD